jgi:hypothetical protein
MPGVTFHPAPHNKIETFGGGRGSAALGANSSIEILRDLRPRDRELVDEVLQSSITPPSSQANTTEDASLAPPFSPRRNGLVHTIIKAYNHHHAVIIRPDDVWITILTQFSLFVNGPGRAEQLRSKFVAHEEKKQLIVNGMATPYATDFGELAKQMTDLIHENVVDPALQKWIIPDFTTTTANDVVTASVIMMATFKAYFEYLGEARCGIPRVTLLGERADWMSILERIEKLKQYGLETKAWYRMLQPVLRRFVLAFDEGYTDSEENRDFWQRVAHYSRGGSGPTYLCGWITAFCTFDNDGKWTGGSLVRFIYLKYLC